MRISDWSSDVCSSDLLHAGMRARRADRLVERVVAHRAEGLAVAGAEALHGGGVEDHLAARLQRQLGGAAGGALGQRVAAPQALQVVAEAVEPQPPPPARRENVHYAAAPPDIARPPTRPHPG